MSFGKLSPPLLLNGDTIIQQIEDSKARFENVFLQNNSRPSYRNKSIFFDHNSNYRGAQLPFSERFMHITSIEESVKHTMFPCQNDISSYKCANQCVLSNAFPDYKMIGRNECLYRSSRIHWIPEILALADQQDPNISQWSTSEKDKRNKTVKKRYIRYTEELVDYVVILKEEWQRQDVKFYKFITAFPVFLKRNKDQFTLDYQKNK